MKYIYEVYIYSLFFTGDTDGQKLVYGGLESEVKKYIFQCYDCNSEYDPRCGDPFNNYSIGIVNCTEKKIPEQLMDIDRPDRQLVPSVCRKIVQKSKLKNVILIFITPMFYR